MIELTNIVKTYKMGNISFNALNNISLEVSSGDFVAIMGPSGSGKSTLLNILGCLDTPTSGKYILSDKDVSKLSDDELAEIRNTKIGFVFQNFNLIPRLTAIDNVILPLIYGRVPLERKQKALTRLKAVALDDRALHRPNELSGGEQQRVTIARALVNNPVMILADEPTGNLDSKSGKEIMDILCELNDKGITIILITHDEKIALYAKRIIRVQDGEIIEDKKVDKSPNCSRKVPDKSSTVNSVSSTPAHLFSLAGIRESLSMSVASLVSTKLRSFLTMLGIIIGVASVIMMIALGQGASLQVTEHIKSMGANLLTVFPGSSRQGRVHMGMGSTISLTANDAEAIENNCYSVTQVSPSYSGRAQVVYKNKNTYTSIEGTTPEYTEVCNSPVETGSFFTDRDDKLMRKVAVLGKTVVKDLFEGENPIGEYIKINRVNFQVIGVMKSKGSGGWHDEDDIILVPLTAAQKRLFSAKNVSRIYVQAKSESLMTTAESEITTLLRTRHRIKDKDESDFTIRSQETILSMVQETSKTFTLLLAGIAIVSLIVGGIGIMNIMLVSVAERTREIGIRKAIGGRRRDILSQFLIEALILSLTGGVIGILLGSAVSEATSKLANWPTVISPPSVVLAFFFAFAVGVFFGIYPANKASKLRPIEALRYE